MIHWLRALSIVGTLLGFLGSPMAFAADPPIPVVHLGPATPVFDPARDGCDANDVPDAPARAFRAADGAIHMFGLHYTNHFLAGPTFDALKIVCRSALPSNGRADPAAYDDKSWVAATWTRDGTVVDGLAHHEFQADSHPGLCRFPDYMRCWFNTILAIRSADGGAGFAKAVPPVVASAPFPQSVEQGRHRGFFNPSNMAGDGRFVYALIATTGWTGQDGGACLFRTANPDRSDAWRAFDGRDFTIAYSDPYGRRAGPWPAPCRTIAPFPAPVGSLVRQRGSGLWLATFQASGNASAFPVSGFYVVASRDLLTWSAPRLILAGVTNYDNPCGSGGEMIAYPSLIDPDATGRNFDDVGTRAVLFYARTRVDGCTPTSDRVLVRRPVSIALETGR